MFCSKCGKENLNDARFCVQCGTPLFQTSTPQQVQQQPMPAAELVSTTVRYAGFWRRFVSSICDFIVLYLFLGILYSIRNLPVEWIYFTISIIQWLYFTLLENSKWQATLGKLALRIKVTDQNGNRVSLLRANARYWSKAPLILMILIGPLIAALLEATTWNKPILDVAVGRVILIVVFIVFIGFIMAGFTQKKQALHDIIAGTLVVRK